MGFIIFLITLAGLATGLFCSAGSAWSKKKYGLGSVCFFMGFVILLMFGLTCYEIYPELGSPETKINPGIYKVGFVYQAGSNINVGIEKKGGEFEHLFLYQFPATDFEGEIKPGAKKLVAYKLTTGDGTFNRYKLE